MNENPSDDLCAQHRAEHEARLAEPCWRCADDSERARQDANRAEHDRQRRIDLAAKSILSAYFTPRDGDFELLSQFYQDKLKERDLAADCDAAYRFSAALDSARARFVKERAVGGKQ